MHKRFQKDYRFPLSRRITILGLRVETGPRPLYDISPGVLKLKDDWKIQIVYKPGGGSGQEAPLLMEVPVGWEEELEWGDNLPAALSVSYQKKPQSVSAWVYETLETTAEKFTLNLTLETIVEIDFDEKATPARTETAVKVEMKSIVEELKRLASQVNELEEKLACLENETSLRPAAEIRISGYVLDSFTLTPVGKCIIEFCPQNGGTAGSKTATDGRGFYTVNGLAPGTYDLKIRHPRFAPLVIKDYVIGENADKHQDFLLRRV